MLTEGHTLTLLPAAVHSTSQGSRFSISATVDATSLTVFESSPTWSFASCVVWVWCQQVVWAETSRLKDLVRFHMRSEAQVQLSRSLQHQPTISSRHTRVNYHGRCR